MFSVRPDRTRPNLTPTLKPQAVTLTPIMRQQDYHHHHRRRHHHRHLDHHQRQYEQHNNNNRTPVQTLIWANCMLAEDSCFPCISNMYVCTCRHGHHHQDLHQPANLCEEPVDQILEVWAAAVAVGGVAVVVGAAGWRKERRTLRLLLLLLLEEIKGVTRETNTRTTPNINP